MAIQRTLSIIKPDAVAKNVIGEIISRFEFHIVIESVNKSSNLLITMAYDVVRAPCL